METKKISFGFSKINKKPNLLIAKPLKDENKIELIKCLEGQEIKLINEKQVEAPLVIPMQTNQKTSTALASLMRQRAVLFGEDVEKQSAATTEAPATDNVNNTVVPEDLEKRAAYELLAAVQTNGDTKTGETQLVLPALKADELPLDGAKESSIDDYDSVPIDKFGLAMLRGMGWVDPPKKKDGPPIDETPFVRPKGMGLGADKALKAKPLLVKPEANEVLEIKKQAYVRILGGKHKDLYGQIEGFDDHAGRVIVKMAIGGAKEAFNEFLCQPVSKKEYTQYSKCINSAKYDEYKKLENEYGQIVKKQEKHETKAEKGKEERKERQQIKEEYNPKNQEQTSKHKEYKIKDERHQSRSRYDDDSKQRSSKITDSYKFSKDDKDDTRTRHTDAHRSRQERFVDDNERHTSSKNSSSQRYRDEAGKGTVRERHVSRSPTATRQKSNSSNNRNSKVNNGKNNTQDSRRHNDESDIESNDTSYSTESDTDSAYERRKRDKKKSHGKSKKSKKTKKSKNKSHASNSDEDEDSSFSEEEHSSRRRHQSKHKKKTKKSKHARSRTRSRSRDRR